MTRRVMGCIACAAAALALVFAVAADTRGADASTAAKPNWLLIPAFWPHGTGPWIEGAASGRGWLGFSRGDGPTRSTILGSLRRVGGKTSFVKVPLPRSQGPMMIVGSELYYHLPDISGKPGALRVVSLLANGGIGTPQAPNVDPESIPPAQYDAVVVAAAQVSNRVVWILAGSRGTTFNLWACCTSTGELSPLTRLINSHRGRGSLQLDVDSKGRVWLAWGGAAMVELDPDTLAPRTPKPFVSQPRDSWLEPRLVCANLCRVVGSDLGGDVITWAPGERSVTRIRRGTRENPATLIDASFRSGKLAVASVKTLTYRRAPWSAEEISIVRGDVRGAHARRVSSVAPTPFGPRRTYFWQPPMYGAFVPGAFVFFKLYYNFRNDRQTRVLVGSLPG